MDKTPRITAIKPQKRNSHRYAIFVNDEFATGVSEEVILKLRLRRGEPVTAERLAQIIAVEQDSQARRAALNLLEYRARTRRELAQRLRKKGLPDESIERVIADLEASGLVDDEQFAQQMTKSLIRSRNLSHRAILSKLRQAGVDSDTAQAVVEQELGDYDEHSRAEQAAAQQMRHLSRLDQTTQRRRLYGYLQRRGFPHYVIAQVVQQFLDNDQ